MTALSIDKIQDIMMVIEDSSKYTDQYFITFLQKIITKDEFGSILYIKSIFPKKEDEQFLLLIACSILNLDLYMNEDRVYLIEWCICKLRLLKENYSYLNRFVFTKSLLQVKCKNFIQNTDAFSPSAWVLEILFILDNELATDCMEYWISDDNPYTIFQFLNYIYPYIDEKGFIESDFPFDYIDEYYFESWKNKIKKIETFPLELNKKDIETYLMMKEVFIHSKLGKFYCS